MQLNVPVIGILRGVDAGWFGEVMAASFAAGLEAIEVTMNTPGAEKIVAAHREKVPAGRLLGMGTIRNIEEARRAADSGAMFLVSPNLDEAVIAFARRRGIPMVAGALTPTEVYRARRAGADLIKVFPCAALGGPGYIRALRGPFDDIPLVAVGGVTLDNLADYRAAGAWGVGAGPAMFGAEALGQRDIEAVARHTAQFISRCRAVFDRV